MKAVVDIVLETVGGPLGRRERVKLTVAAHWYDANDKQLLRDMPNALGNDFFGGKSISRGKVSCFLFPKCSLSHEIFPFGGNVKFTIFCF